MTNPPLQRQGSEKATPAIPSFAHPQPLARPPICQTRQEAKVRDEYTGCLQTPRGWRNFSERKVEDIQHTFLD